MWALLSRAHPGSRRVARSWGLVVVEVVVVEVVVGVEAVVEEVQEEGWVCGGGGWVVR